MLDPIKTNVPGQQPIELVAYYPEYKKYYVNCELATKRWFVDNAKRDWVYLDCGANIGYYSILFSRLSPGGRIYAFEPTTTIEMLKKNISHHDAKNVVPVPLALGKVCGEIQDKIFRIWSKDPEENVYPFVTIDEFVRMSGLAKLDCIKIDVDSYDFEVLQGAKKTLVDFDPFVMVELNHALAKRGQSAAQALEWLTDLGYERVVFFEYENCLLKKHIPAPLAVNKKIEVFFVPSSYGSAHSETVDVKTEILRGENLFLEGKKEKALAFFESLLEQFPNEHQIYNNIGVVHYQNGDLKKALLSLEKGRALCSTDNDLICNQAVVLVALGQKTQALAVCREIPEASADKRIARLAASLAKQVNSPPQQKSPLFTELPVDKLHQVFGFAQQIAYPQSCRETPLDRWKMEINDAPIFRYLYRNFRPRRHLEFGTWQGAGTVYCLEECDASVWTINLPFGEDRPEGGDSYCGDGDSLGLQTSMAQQWAQRIGLPAKSTYRTDSFGFIGRFYLEKGLGHRVCQVYCDSTKWDDAAYPDGFFDSILIDGGHSSEVVVSDTQKALRLLRPGGLLMWHDFCPPVAEKFPVTRGVRDGLARMAGELSEQMRGLSWIDPSWILVGLKK